uniref:Uncharacterized protein n=1 Tax=Globodera rostochiensis TaxID=31243 RepID=A0A914HTY0_GLORO
MPAPTNFGQNVHHQIGQIEPNSTDQLGQIEPNSTDQDPPLTEFDHSDNAKNGEDERKRKIVKEFHAIKDEFKQKGKYSKRERTQIEVKIAKHLKRKAELKRAGLKNSYSNQIDETAAKELGLSLATIYRWKRELGQTGEGSCFPTRVRCTERLLAPLDQPTNKSKTRYGFVPKHLIIFYAILSCWTKSTTAKRSGKLILPHSISELRVGTPIYDSILFLPHVLPIKELFGASTDLDRLFCQHKWKSYSLQQIH